MHFGYSFTRRQHIGGLKLQHFWKAGLKVQGFENDGVSLQNDITSWIGIHNTEFLVVFMDLCNW